MSHCDSRPERPDNETGEGKLRGKHTAKFAAVNLCYDLSRCANWLSRLDPARPARHTERPRKRGSGPGRRRRQAYAERNVQHQQKPRCAFCRHFASPHRDLLRVRKMQIAGAKAANGPQPKARDSRESPTVCESVRTASARYGAQFALMLSIFRFAVLLQFPLDDQRHGVADGIRDVQTPPLCKSFNCLIKSARKGDMDAPLSHASMICD